MNTFEIWPKEVVMDTWFCNYKIKKRIHQSGWIFFRRRDTRLLMLFAPIYAAKSHVSFGEYWRLIWKYDISHLLTFHYQFMFIACLTTWFVISFRDDSFCLVNAHKFVDRTRFVFEWMLCFMPIFHIFTFQLFHLSYII